MESACQQRADLIPNLVTVVKRYAKHEQDTLTAVAETRAGQVIPPADKLGDPAATAQFQQARGALGSLLSRLVLVVARYPDLKANRNSLDLQGRLEGGENRINAAPPRYNRAVETFIPPIRIFLNNQTSNLLMHLPLKEPFRAEEGAGAEG